MQKMFPSKSVEENTGYNHLGGDGAEGSGTPKRGERGELKAVQPLSHDGMSRTINIPT
jgi:hypothetical protein